MSGFSAALQTGLYVVLTGASPAIMDGRWYEDTPESIVYPLGEIGESVETPDDVGLSAGGGDAGMSSFYDLHVWTEQESKHQVKEILDQIHSELHGVDIAASVTGRASAICWVRSQRVLKDPDGIRRHGVAQIEIVHRST